MKNTVTLYTLVALLTQNSLTCYIFVGYCVGIVTIESCRYAVDDKLEAKSLENVHSRFSIVPSNRDKDPLGSFFYEELCVCVCPWIRKKTSWPGS